MGLSSKRFLIALVAICVTASAFAADHDPYSGAPLPPDQQLPIPSPITDHFYVEGIFYNPAVSTGLRVDSSQTGAIGTPVSGERDLGLDARTPMGRLEMGWRLKDRNRIRFDYLESDRSAYHTLTEPIQFGNESFSSGQVDHTILDWRMFGFTYTYSFWRSDWLEVGTGVGIHFLMSDVTGQVTTATQTKRQEVSGAGAFPTIPLDVTWRISRRWALAARGQYFHATVSDFSGWLADVHEDIQYRWKSNFSVGAGWQSTRMSLRLQTGDFPGVVSLAFEGPEAFFKVSF